MHSPYWTYGYFPEHDFFSAQPSEVVESVVESGTIVFLLKQILHDWADEYAEKILLRLREAAEQVLRLDSYTGDGYVVKGAWFPQSV
jgi:hypothetical protein